MKVYLEKGHGMSASMQMVPYKATALQSAEGLPDCLKGWSICLQGRGDEEVTFHGTEDELRAISLQMADLVGRMTDADKTDVTLGPYVHAEYMEDVPDPGRPIRLSVNGGKSYMLTKEDAEHLWYSLTSAIGRC